MQNKIRVTREFDTTLIKIISAILLALFVIIITVCSQDLTTTTDEEVSGFCCDCKNNPHDNPDRSYRYDTGQRLATQSPGASSTITRR